MNTPVKPSILQNPVLKSAMKTQRKKAQMFSAVFAFQLPSNAAWKVLERSHDGLCKDHSKAKQRGPLWTSSLHQQEAACLL
jgi:hypothetical protein